MKCKKGFKKVDGKCKKVKSKLFHHDITIYRGGRAEGLGFTSVLTLIFITLKLWGKISWSWWWVLSPFWISMALGLVAILIFIIIEGRYK